MIRTNIHPSGHRIFSHGDEGAAHAAAHRMLDHGQIALGCERLGAWLDGRTGAGSRWAHLQYHMALFELGVGDWNAAYERFLNEILPIAESSEDALTDGPGLLWQLAIASPSPVDLPWEVLRQTALESMGQIREPFVELHHLLAFAGAHDAASIDTWLHIHESQIRSARERLVVRTGVALRAYANRFYAAAGIALERLAPQLQEIGGSGAQNAVFKNLADYCRRRAHDPSAILPCSVAA